MYGLPEMLICISVYSVCVDEMAAIEAAIKWVTGASSKVGTRSIMAGADKRLLSDSLDTSMRMRTRVCYVIISTINASSVATLVPETRPTCLGTLCGQKYPSLQR